MTEIVSSAVPHVKPILTKKFERYSDKLRMARKAARDGYGWEDLQVKFHILPRDAWKIVFKR